MRLIDADILPRHGKRGGLVYWRDIVETRTKGEWEVYIATVEDFFNTVYSMPTIDAEPVKHGKWIEHESGIAHGHCSICGWEAIYYETDIIDEANYCPNCGARMDKE